MKMSEHLHSQPATNNKAGFFSLNLSPSLSRFPAARNKRSWADSGGRVSARFVSYTASPPRWSDCIESLTQDAEEEEGKWGKALEPTSICLSEPDTSLRSFHSTLLYFFATKLVLS